MQLADADTMQAQEHTQNHSQDIYNHELRTALINSSPISSLSSWLTPMCKQSHSLVQAMKAGSRYASKQHSALRQGDTTVSQEVSGDVRHHRESASDLYIRCHPWHQYQEKYLEISEGNKQVLTCQTP